MLVNKIEVFRRHVPVNKNMLLVSFLPDIELVETERIKPLIGTALYNQLDAKVQGNIDLAAAEQAVLSALQAAISYLAALEVLPFAQVQFSDEGVHIVSTGDKKVPFQWQMRQLEASFKRKGFAALERVLAVLDELNDDPELQAWATSAAATAARRNLINSAAQFSEHYNIGASRVTFLAMLPVLRKLERFSIEPEIGTDLYLELKEELLARDVSADNTKLLDEYVRPALAHLTAARAVLELGLAWNGEALELNIHRVDDANSKEVDPSLDQLLTAKATAAEVDGKAYLAKMRTYLNNTASATRYAAYFNSPLYQAPGGERIVVRNQPCSATYSFLG